MWCYFEKNEDSNYAKASKKVSIRVDVKINTKLGTKMDNRKSGDQVNLLNVLHIFEKYKGLNSTVMMVNLF